MGKAYANRKQQKERPKNDLYSTPMSCVWELLKRETFYSVFEPANGLGAISNALKDSNIEVEIADISTGQDFLQNDKTYSEIVTNPPFYLWDEFILKAKEVCTYKFAFIGRLNYLGTHKRNIEGLFNECRTIYVFDRMIDYRTPYREDGLFHLGALVTGWFVWEKDYKGNPEIKQIDMQEYAALGAYDCNCKACGTKINKYVKQCPLCLNMNKKYMGEISGG